MEAERANGLNFGTTVDLLEDALLRSERGLMPLPDGSYVAVQRSSSSDPAFLVDGVVGGHQLRHPSGLWLRVLLAELRTLQSSRRLAEQLPCSTCDRYARGAPRPVASGKVSGHSADRRV